MKNCHEHLGCHLRQLLVLQDALPLEEPEHCCPPFDASVCFVRLLFLVPPPHVWLQLPQDCHWAQAQFTAVTLIYPVVTIQI